MRAHAASCVINISEEKTIKGQVISAKNNKFTVETQSSVGVYDARGIFKLSRTEILTGDYVEVDKRSIIKVYPRKSRFLRPNVANVDMVNIIISNPPAPDYLIVDKLLLIACYSGVEACITVNKSDLGEDIKRYVLDNYSEVTDKIFFVSAKSGEGIEKLKEHMRGKTVAFAGQSAVGKTSLVNALLGTDYKTGDVSEKTERGRHTTTYSSIIKADGLALFDTPGFSELYADVGPYEVPNNFPPYDTFITQCKYADCSHVSEPDCIIKQYVEQNKLSSDRYERYKTILKDIQVEYKERYGK